MLKALAFCAALVLGTDYVVGLFLPLRDNLETCMQVDPVTIWSRKANCDAWKESFESGRTEYHFGARGHRNIEPGPYQVAALGDSFTEGAMVNADQVYIHRLGIPVDDWAVSGWDLRMYHERLPEVLATHPKVVIVGLVSHNILVDLDIAKMRADLKTLGPEQMRRHQWPGLRAWVHSHCYLSGFCKAAGDLADPYASASGKSWTDAQARAAAALLRDMARQCTEANVRMLVVLIPHPSEILGHALGPESTIKAQIPGVEVVDFSAAAKPDHYFPYDGHLTAAGHAALGAMVKAALH